MKHPRLIAPLLTVVAMATLGLGACSNDSADDASNTTAVPAATAGKVVSISPEQGATLIEDTPEVQVVDVRTPAEYAQGHLAGATNIDFEAADFQTRLDGLDKEATYVVYCRSGNRSGMATKAMAAAGFSRVYDLGGIQAWQDAGQPVVTT